MSGAGAIEDGVAAGAGVAASGRVDGSGGESKQRCSGEPQTASGGRGREAERRTPGPWRQLNSIGGVWKAGGCRGQGGHR